MNKTLLAGSLMTCISLSLSAQTAFQIKGDLKDTSRNGEKVTISYFNGDKKVYTAAVVKDGTFTIDGTVIDPAMATLSISTTKKMREANPWVMSEKCSFFIEGGLVTLAGPSLAKAAIKAPGKSQEDFLKLSAKLKPFYEKEAKSFIDMLNAVVAKDTVARNGFSAINEQSKEQIDSIEVAFLKANPSSHVSLGLIEERVSAKNLSKDKEMLAGWYNKLTADLKGTVVGKQLSEQIKTAFKLGPGNLSEDFVLNDTLGNPVHLSSFKGKYVLLDFWASWCIPCRAENKTVIKAYEQFKDKKFTVLSVSLEKPGDRKAWVDAILKDGLTWTQVATLTSEESSKMRKLYGIQSIPMNFLIDPQGKIVATYLRGEELIKKLEDIL
jgi:peroxiredoxin